ncbi:MAG: cation diffusion facilitator family transporter [Mycobacteriales bacterium]|nr:MAG: cation transporter [Pseudonocardiales bacterium]
MSHEHEHPFELSRRRLAMVLAITIGVLAAEVMGALLAGSVALLADAGHLATDAVGIGITLVAATCALRAPTPSKSFGLHRLEALGSMANALLLSGMGCYVVVQGIRHLVTPHPVAAGTVAVFAMIGLIGNACSAALLGSGREASLGMRAAFLEVVADGMASGAVLIAAGVIALTGWDRADAVASLLIAAFILPRTWRLMRETVDVLLEGSPRGVDMSQVRAHILGVAGVVEVHDLHAWLIGTGRPVLTAHVVVDDETFDRGGQGPVLDELCGCLSGHFSIEHSTFQVEPRGHSAHEGADHA